MSTHNLCIFSKIRKIMYTPVNPSLTILAEKRNASINSGVVFLKKIVDFI